MRSIFIIFLALTAISCAALTTTRAPGDYDIKQSDVDRIVVGQTTEKGVVQIFGDPAAVRPTAQGKEFLYEYAETGGDAFVLGSGSSDSASVQKILKVWLNKEGVVSDYEYKKS